MTEPAGGETIAASAAAATNDAINIKPPEKEPTGGLSHASRLFNEMRVQTGFHTEVHTFVAPRQIGLFFESRARRRAFRRRHPRRARARSRGRRVRAKRPHVAIFDVSRRAPSGGT